MHWILHRSTDFRIFTLSVCNVDLEIQLILCENQRKLAMLFSRETLFCEKTAMLNSQIGRFSKNQAMQNLEKMRVCQRGQCRISENSLAVNIGSGCYRRCSDDGISGGGDF